MVSTEKMAAGSVGLSLQIRGTPHDEETRKLSSDGNRDQPRRGGFQSPKDGDGESARRAGDKDSDAQLTRSEI